jgi:hypothetical protein
MLRLILIPLAAALLLTGCITPAPPEPEITSGTDNREPARQISPIDALLIEAELAFQAKRLTTPLDDNAYFRYLQVLSIDPNNTTAQIGLQRIVDTYLAWSIKAIDTGRYRRATSMLNKAHSIDEYHPSIEALEKRIARAETSTSNTYRLEPTALASRSGALVGQLHELGREAEKNNAKVRITAGSDADGRWIYQQLNAASVNRIRAIIELGRPAKIELTYP